MSLSLFYNNNHTLILTISRLTNITLLRQRQYTRSLHTLRFFPHARHLRSLNVLPTTHPPLQSPILIPTPPSLPSSHTSPSPARFPHPLHSLRHHLLHRLQLRPPRLTYRRKLPPHIWSRFPSRPLRLHHLRQFLLATLSFSLSHSLRPQRRRRHFPRGLPPPAS